MKQSIQHSIRVSVPAHISAIFSPYWGETPSSTGSLGVGFTLEEGVEVTVSDQSEGGFFLNGTAIDIGAVSYVIDQFEGRSQCLVATSQFELGAGLGLSGALALGVAHGLNRALGLERSARELAELAHSGEVASGTGLGDVAGQYLGGVVCRTTKGEPLEGERLSLRKEEVWIRNYGGISTKEILSDSKKIEVIQRVGKEITEKVSRESDITLKKILDAGYQFATETGLLLDRGVVEIIDRIRKNGGSATMGMLGNTVVSDQQFEGANRFKIGGVVHNA